MIKKIQRLCMKLCNEVPEPEKFNSVVDGILLVFLDEIEKLTQTEIINIDSPDMLEGDVKFKDVNKNVNEVLYINEVEQHVDQLTWLSKNSNTTFNGTVDELERMSKGENIVSIRDEYYKGKDDKYFADVLELLSKKIK